MGIFETVNRKCIVSFKFILLIDVHNQIVGQRLNEQNKELLKGVSISLLLLHYLPTILYALNMKLLVLLSNLSDPT